MKDFKNELEKIKGKTLMVIFPHPDDESMMTGGLLFAAKKIGIRTVVVTLTKGEAGKIHIHPKGKSTREVRGNELKSACKKLRVDKLYCGNFSDGNLKSDVDVWNTWLLDIIKNEKPALIVTYDHSGLTGHPDHIIASKVILRLVQNNDLERSYPARRGIALYWVSLNSKLKDWFVPKGVEENFCEPTHVLDIGNYWIKKWLAVKSHKSQKYAQIKISMPLWFFLSKYHWEWYHEVDLKKQYKLKYMKFNI